MFSKQRLLDLFNNITRTGISPQKIALSFCIGVYIAFSPFPGLHAVIMFLLNWILDLNFPILFLATSLNNPWTMIPFYSLDYFFGHWVVHEVFGLDPSFAISLAKIFGSGKICLASFFVGGNILGIVTALISYPIVVLLSKRFLKPNKACL